MLIDEFLPDYDVVERHAIIIDSPLPLVYGALRKTDFGRSPVVRTLLALRGLPSLLLSRHGRSSSSNQSVARLTLDSFLRNGFVILSEKQDREIVLGLVGRFWTPTGCLEETDPLRFQREERPGLAKAAWNFAFERYKGATRVTTETRVKCTDRSSRLRFRGYWLAIGPFSGLLRRCMLRELRRASEVRDSVQP